MTVQFPGRHRRPGPPVRLRDGLIVRLQDQGRRRKRPSTGSGYVPEPWSGPWCRCLTPPRGAPARLAQRPHRASSRPWSLVAPADRQGRHLEHVCGRSPLPADFNVDELALEFYDGARQPPRRLGNLSSMALWRREAIEAFPELRRELNDDREISSMYDLWFELLPRVRIAHREGRDDFLRRAYSYADWCRQESSRRSGIRLASRSMNTSSMSLG